MDVEPLHSWECASFNEKKDPRLWQIKQEVVSELMALNCAECRRRAAASIPFYREHYCKKLRADPETAELFCKEDCADYRPACELVHCERCQLEKQLIGSPFLPIQQLLIELNDIFATMPVDGRVLRLNYNCDTGKIDMERVNMTDDVAFLDEDTGEVYIPIGKVEKVVHEPIYGVPDPHPPADMDADTDAEPGEE